MTEILVQHTDITRLEVNAIVNAANTSLLGGGGVDGAIHRAAGPELLNYCKTLGGCDTGEARITPGYRLLADHIIHTVGPVWHGGHQGEKAELQSCYRQCLKLTGRHHIPSIAFPAISCGVYGYPHSEACATAVEEVCSYLTDHTHLQLVIFACFSEAMCAQYKHALSRRTF
ncbi:O-acetyl-ADP-ribose deacetylase [Teredinibacter franksiae]|uniref:O-acetyl-ADP-ribose deacetylase n=1 Tax=Teredinibacter franksiae TaxID=2761453 RepID=UPI001626A52E|nr:O-acetyl-ADP-ribose deacetylase [Teredinibacter franksiae]